MLNFLSELPFMIRGVASWFTEVWDEVKGKASGRDYLYLSILNVVRCDDGGLRE